MAARRGLIRSMLALAIGGGTAMTAASDDLSGLFNGDTASVPSVPLRYRQGKVLSWNPITLNNTVLVGETVFQNLPVLGVAEAAAIVAGARVGIAVIEGSFAIMGRYVVPNTPEATDAITLVGQRTQTAGIDTYENTGSTAFTDLATVGPVVETLIQASGKALVTVSATIFNNTIDTSGGMDFRIDSPSATIRFPTTNTNLEVDPFGTGGTVAHGASRTVLVEGLTAGVKHTFTCKYRAINGGAANFGFRSLIVTAL